MATQEEQDLHDDIMKISQKSEDEGCHELARLGRELANVIIE